MTKKKPELQQPPQLREAVFHLDRETVVITWRGTIIVEPVMGIIKEALGC